MASVLSLLVSILLIGRVQAHATLVRSDPADSAVLLEAPEEIRLWFDEAISPKFSSAQLFDVNSRPVQLVGIQTDPNDPSVLILSVPDLEPGVYSLLYKVLSETDGHFSQGVLVFGVGEGMDVGTAPVVETQETVPLPEIFLRWGNFSLIAALIGAMAVIHFILPRSGEDYFWRAIVIVTRRRVLGWTTWCAMLAFGVGVGLLLWQAITLRRNLPDGVPTQAVIWQILSQTRWGWLWLARQSILLVLSVIFVWLYHLNMVQRSRSSETPIAAAVSVLAGILAIMLVILQTLTGHAAAIAPHTTLAVIIDSLHMLAASMWVGGLLTLAVTLLPLSLHRRDDLVRLAQVGWRPFSTLAALSVGLLIVTGLYNTGRQVASVDALLTTGYGQALLGKIGLVVGVGLFGLLNSVLLHPHLAVPLGRLMGRPAGWRPLALRHLPGLVLAEVSLGLLVMWATGLITASPAPRGPVFTVIPEDIPSALSQTVDDLVVTLQVKPNRPGQNVMTVFAASTRRPPPAEIIRVILRFTYLEQDLGRVSAKAEEVEPGRYLLGGNHLSLAGLWQIEVVVRRKGLEDSVAYFNWLVAPPGEARPVVVSKARLEQPLTIAAAGLILIGLLVSGIWLGRRKVSRFEYYQAQTRPPSEIVIEEIDHAWQDSQNPNGSHNPVSDHAKRPAD